MPTKAPRSASHRSHPNRTAASHATGSPPGAPRTVALESATMAASHIDDRRLTPVLGMNRCIKVKAHFVVYPARHARKPAVEAFLAWVHGEASRR